MLETDEQIERHEREQPAAHCNVEGCRPIFQLRAGGHHIPDDRTCTEQRNEDARVLQLMQCQRAMRIACV